MITYFDKSYHLPVCKYRGRFENIKFPCYVSLKLDGELQYIVKKGDTIFSVNKDKYGRVRKSYPALDEFAKLELQDGVYLAELYWGDGRTKQEFYQFLSNKASDELRLAIWGILQMEKNVMVDTDTTYRILADMKDKCKGFKYLSIVPFWYVRSKGMLIDLTNRILDEGWEGLVVRNKDAVYIDGQSVKWVKIKKKEREIGEKTKNGAKINFKLKNYGVWM